MSVIFTALAFAASDIQVRSLALELGKNSMYSICSLVFSFIADTCPFGFLQNCSKTEIVPLGFWFIFLLVPWNKCLSFYVHSEISLDSNKFQHCKMQHYYEISIEKLKPEIMLEKIWFDLKTFNRLIVKICWNLAVIQIPRRIAIWTSFKIFVIFFRILVCDIEFLNNSRLPWALKKIILHWQQ